jgi:predicted metal-binding protein
MIALCRHPYPAHPKGCPNFGKKKGCPPQLLFNKIFNTRKTIFAIVNEFPIGQHIEKMRQKHPDWSERQLSCCLYWQGTARKKLRENVANFELIYPEYTVSHCPEAMGVNLTETMKQVGVELEWPPRETAYQIALAGMLL